MGYRHVYRESLQVVSQLLEVQCDACGHKVNSNTGWMPEGFHRISLCGGYGSHFPADNEAIEIVTCDDCLEKWVSTFKNPNVSRGTSFWDVPFQAWLSTTGEEVLVDNHWIRVSGDTPTNDQPWREPPETPDEFPTPTESERVWEHYKGQRYDVLGPAWDARDLTLYVVYRALYGESKVWCRPFSEWFDIVDGQVRFTCVGTKG